MVTTLLMATTASYRQSFAALLLLAVVFLLGELPSKANVAAAPTYRRLELKETQNADDPENALDIYYYNDRSCEIHFRAQDKRTVGWVCDNSSISSGGGGCIYRSYLCDGVPNCANGEDENPTFCHTRQCEPDKGEGFRCPSGRCLPVSLRCDGKPDCPSGSKSENIAYDELFCPCQTDKRLEENDEFDGYSCKTSRITSLQECVPKLAWCDGKRNCSNGNDENKLICTVMDYVLNGGEFPSETTTSRARTTTPLTTATPTTTTTRTTTTTTATTTTTTTTTTSTPSTTSTTTSQSSTSTATSTTTPRKTTTTTSTAQRTTTTPVDEQGQSAITVSEAAKSTTTPAEQTDAKSSPSMVRSTTTIDGGAYSTVTAGGVMSTSTASDTNSYSSEEKNSSPSSLLSTASNSHSASSSSSSPSITSDDDKTIIAVSTRTSSLHSGRPTLLPETPSSSSSELSIYSTHTSSSSEDSSMEITNEHGSSSPIKQHLTSSHFEKLYTTASYFSGLDEEHPSQSSNDEQPWTVGEDFTHTADPLPNVDNSGRQREDDMVVYIAIGTIAAAVFVGGLIFLIILNVRRTAAMAARKDKGAMGDRGAYSTIPTSALFSAKQPQTSDQTPAKPANNNNGNAKNGNNGNAASQQQKTAPKVSQTSAPPTQMTEAAVAQSSSNRARTENTEQSDLSLAVRQPLLPPDNTTANDAATSTSTAKL